MVTFRRLHHKLVRLSKIVPQKPLRKFERCENLCSVVPGTKTAKSQAVSDGELNMSARSCGGSSSSLPETPGGAGDQGNSVLRWAVSFENLLEDPCGVRYFTAFLMSEVSAENILFWQACEKFKKIPATSLIELKTAARSMYNMYLSESAPYSVNIDDSARIEEQDLERPVPDMFNKAQAQIFKLMKMDSYRRFVRSPMYQSCISVEDKPPPPQSSESNKGSRDNVNKSPHSDKKNRKSDLSGLRSKHHQKRGSWGEVEASAAHILVSRKESQMSTKSTSSVELGSLYRQIENGRPGPLPSDDSGCGRLGVEGGYCCVYLPDGSASLAPTRTGLPIRDMLQGLCEKRGFPLKDVIIYLHGKDKQPLSLDQDCTVLRDQQVSLELRVTFALEIAFTGKTVGIMVKSSKTLQDALSAVLQKHQLKLHEVQLSMAGSAIPVNMNTSVFKLANTTLRLDKAKGKDPNISKGAVLTTSIPAVMETEGEKVVRSLSLNDRNKAQLKPSKNPDMDGLLDMLTRAQCCRVDDQRGLLTKEQLEVPLFLQQSPESGAEKSETSTPRPTDGEKSECKNQHSPTAAKTKDVRETAV
ncbi:regulator of G-protein signaling 14 isoform X2 [Eucyclogobius newberryi]|uniref:regulator of G-protein signaling 14 isoform X2 n=1 Tax=Eucyclogobius newberryi TaxID=166745 RepID=UPI003B597F37